MRFLHFPLTKILLCIAKVNHRDFDFLLSLLHTCTKLRIIALDNVFWKRLAIPSMLSPGSTISVEERTVRVKRDALILPTVLQIIVPNSGTRIRDFDAHLFSQNLTERALEKINHACPNLDSVDLSCCFAISDSSITALFKDRREKIKRIVLVGITFLTDDIFMSPFTQLTHVNLSGCFQITDVAASKIITECPMIQVMNFSYCWRLTDEFSSILEFPSDIRRKLHTVLLQFCYQLSDATAHRFLNLAMMKLLDMKETGISIVMVHLLNGLGMSGSRLENEE
jgi:hypothetical protein